jgi:hypothetical protein
MSRYTLNLGVIIGAVTIVACSGSDPLKPSPGTTADGFNRDTAIATSPTPPSQPPAPVVSSFALSGTIVGHEPGADTTRVVAVPNATVTLVKIAGVNGDTLVPSVTVTSATTDAAGKFRIENLAPAYYRIDVAAPAGSVYQNGVWGVGPARETEVTVYIALARKP